MRFLGLCERFGGRVGGGRCPSGAGGCAYRGLPCRDDWPAWNAAEMRAAVDYLEQAGAAATESGALDR